LKQIITFALKAISEKNINYWQETLEANDAILDTLIEGYKIPFITLPNSCNCKNNKSSFKSKPFVDSAIKELLDTGRILEVNQKPYCINPLSVATQSNCKHRLILDLGHVNKHVFKDKIKFDDWKIMNEYVNDNNYSFKFDLKQGYHHIEIYPDHQKY